MSSAESVCGTAGVMARIRSISARISSPIGARRLGQEVAKRLLQRLALRLGPLPKPFDHLVIEIADEDLSHIFIHSRGR